MVYDAAGSSLDRNCDDRGSGSSEPGTDTMARGTAIPWRTIADLVWQGKTVPEACASLGLDFGDTDVAMSSAMRGFLIDVATVAHYRDKELL